MHVYAYKSVHMQCSDSLENDSFIYYLLTLTRSRAIKSLFVLTIIFRTDTPTI
jgi:hypothetical protein